jgi:hypothetical protein
VSKSVSKRNLAELLPLIQAHQELYKISDISDDRNAGFFLSLASLAPQAVSLSIEKRVVLWISPPFTCRSRQQLLQKSLFSTTYTLFGIAEVKGSGAGL